MRDLVSIPVEACCLQETKAPHSRCKRNHRTTGRYENPYKLDHTECDYGQKPEPEFLEDHVRRYHPRLAPKHKILDKDLNTRFNRFDQDG